MQQCLHPQAASTTIDPGDGDRDIDISTDSEETIQSHPHAHGHQHPPHPGHDGISHPPHPKDDGITHPPRTPHPNDDGIPHPPHPGHNHDGITPPPNIDHDGITQPEDSDERPETYLISTQEPTRHSLNLTEHQHHIAHQMLHHQPKSSEENSVKPISEASITPPTYRTAPTRPSEEKPVLSRDTRTFTNANWKCSLACTHSLFNFGGDGSEYY